MAEIRQNLAKFGRIWPSLAKFCRSHFGLIKFGKIYPSLPEFGSEGVNDLCFHTDGQTDGAGGGGGGRGEGGEVSPFVKAQVIGPSRAGAVIWVGRGSMGQGGAVILLGRGSGAQKSHFFDFAIPNSALWMVGPTEGHSPL